MKFGQNIAFDADTGEGGGTPAPAPAPAIDYDKIASLVEGKQKVAEDQVLKGYFKQQGLSEDEMKSAIEMFKADKASKQPDIGALNQQIADANARAMEAEVKVQAMTLATELGVTVAKMPYLLKMADLTNVAKDGKVDSTQLKTALEAVLKDVPELKATADTGTAGTGFKIGADSSGNGNTDNAKLNEELARTFGVKFK